MKRLITFFSIFVLGAAVAAAQTQPATATAPNNPAATDVAHQYTPAPQQDHNNYGWVGLFGLLGLAGLRRRDSVAVRAHESDRIRDDRFGRGRDDIRKVG